MNPYNYRANSLQFAAIVAAVLSIAAFAMCEDLDAKYWETRAKAGEFRAEYMRLELKFKRKERELRDFDQLRARTRLTRPEAARLIAYTLDSLGIDWDDRQRSAFVEIVWRESRFYVHAKNPESTAYGLMQFLASTSRDYGGRTTDPLVQIAQGAAYVRDRYETPLEALAEHDRKGWY